MLKAAAVVSCVVLVLVVVVGVWVWRTMSQPLYEPGAVRAETNLRAPLAPPQHTVRGDAWLVETDIELHRFSSGTGRSVLVIHGGPGQPSAEPWPGLDLLAGDHTFHYYDQRGSGSSTRPIDRFESRNYGSNAAELERTLGLSAQIADIERIRRILGETRLILVGHSFGAFQAALYAAEFPESVEALVLVAPAPLLQMPNDGADLFETVEALLPADMTADYLRWHDEYMDFRNLFDKSEEELVALNEEFGRFYATAVEERSTHVPEGARPGGWMVHASYLSMGRQHDYRPAMSSVTAPVLILHAADDLQSEDTSRRYLEVFPHARFEVIDDAGHMMYYDQPEAFADVVGSFLP